jgi:phosphate:Na+ symporter
MLEALGGLGFFLLGMLLLTDGLHALAGQSMRKALMRFTHSPVSGAITGTIATALLQSSSATTIAAIGFVGAGLMSFAQALGIIFGANIGTTLTGWLVALVGFKLKLGNLALIMVLLGALLKLFSRGKSQYLGLAIAGFGTLFVGISFLQTGLLELRDWIDFSGFAAGSWSSRFQLLLLGVVITVITQSSSAGVAMALTALHTGTIELEQAAALVIGMDVGTTASAALATLGGSVNARRTGFSHVIYNLMTASMAFFMITPLLTFWPWLFPQGGEAEFALVAFHTIFNITGVIIALPFTYAFAGLIMRIIPGEHSASALLDRRLLTEPALAISAVSKTQDQQFALLLQHLHASLSASTLHQNLHYLEQLQIDLDETQQYLDDIHIEQEKRPPPKEWQEYLCAINILDHLQRLCERCDEDRERALWLRQSDELAAQKARLLSGLNSCIEACQNQQWQRANQDCEALHEELKNFQHHYRQLVTRLMGEDSRDFDIGTRCLQTARWMERISYHLVRISKHLHDRQKART